MYERPSHPDLVVHTENYCLQESAERVIKFLQEKSIVPLDVSSNDNLVRELFLSSINEVKKIEAESFPWVELSEIDVQWLQVLAEGWAAPLTGFMREDQYLQVRSVD